MAHKRTLPPFVIESEAVGIRDGRLVRGIARWQYPPGFLLEMSESDADKDRERDRPS
jgi:hypothetical protein